MSVEVVDLGCVDAASSANAGEAYQSGAERKERLRDGLILLALLFGVCAIFAKTIFLGVPISKLARLTLWDSAFAGYRSGLGGLMDPSLIQLMIPYYFVVAKAWQAGALPLWNQYNGCGVPLLADPQSLVFSPLHAVLAFVPSLRVYNLILVFQLWLGAGGTFLLGRAFGLNRCASVMASIAFAFCPYVDWYMEIIGNGYMLVPLLFWLYIRSAQRPSLQRAALSGLFTAAVILSGHPELSFCCIIAGSLLMIGLILTGAYQPVPQPFAKRAKVAFQQLGITAAVAFCLSAPMLLPFVEYLKFSDSYKYTSGSPLGIPLPLFLLDLLQPALGGASLYLGIIPLLSLPFCLAGKNGSLRRAALSLLAVTVLAEAFTSQLWPLNAIVQATPLKSLIPNYCQPVTLLMMAVLSACGLHNLMESRMPSRSKVTLLAFAITTTLSTFVLIRSNISLSLLNFDSSLSAAHLDWKEWQLLAGLTSLAVALLLTRTLWQQKFAFVPILLCIGLSFYSQFNQAKHALPAQAHFDYPMVPAIAALKDCPTRYVAVGDHLLKPDTNAIYGINDFRFHNPIFPAQFTETMQVVGAQLDGFNQNFNPPLSPKIGMASVSRVLSLQPVWSKGILDGLKANAPKSPCSWPGLRLKALSYGYDRHNKQIVGKLDWQAIVDQLPQQQVVLGGRREWQPGTPTSDWSYSIVLVDESNDTLWFSDNEPIPMQPQFQREFAIPLSKAPANKLTACLQLFNTKTARFVQPIFPRRGKASHLATLFEFTPQELNSSVPAISDTTFSLLKELPPTLRLYENKAALPFAYVVRNVQSARSPEQALAMIGANGFDARNSAVVESLTIPAELAEKPADLSAIPVEKPEKRANLPALQVEKPDKRANSPLILVASKTARAWSHETATESNRRVDQTNSSDKVSQYVAAAVERLSATDVSVKTHCDQPGLLVLTDTFYPGWKAQVDGKPAEIVRTNGMFRGVFLAGGDHSVRFTFVPLWFYVGTVLALLCSAALLLGALLNRLRGHAAGRKAS